MQNISMACFFFGGIKTPAQCYFQILPFHVYLVYQNVYQNAPGTRCAAAGIFSASTKSTPQCLPKRYLRDFDETRIRCSARGSGFSSTPPKGRYAAHFYVKKYLFSMKMNQKANESDAKSSKGGNYP